jgi:hypothetical protein
LRRGGAVGFAQASHEQYRNPDKRASEWNVAPSFLLMRKQVRNVKLLYKCTVLNKPRSERPARARHRRLLGGASELGLGTVTPHCGLSRQFGLPPGPASSPTVATGRTRTHRRTNSCSKSATKRTSVGSKKLTLMFGLTTPPQRDVAWAMAPAVKSCLTERDGRSRPQICI